MSASCESGSGDEFYFLGQGPWDILGHVPEPIRFDPGGTDPREMGKIEIGLFIG